MVAALFLAGTGRGMAHGVAPTFAAAATAALMLLLTRIASRTLQAPAPALVMLGRYSFGIYVWHFIAILGVRAVVRIDAVDDFAEYHGVLVFAVSMVVATIVAYAGARLTARRIEEPCSRWAREWLARDALKVPGRRGAAADGTEGI
jgi:peptidoglycan/LPS O-acetylase OafA/YrhL